MKLNFKANFSPTDDSATILTKILTSRRLTPKQQSEFLHPTKPDPKLMSQALKISPKSLKQFSQRIHQALERQENICIFGDYDADGLTSTAILWQSLHRLGAKVMPFIPHRQKHGYGLSKVALKEILSGQAFNSPFIPSLLITTDTGIVAHKEIAWLKDRGVDVLLTDHHQPEAKLPPADLILHSTVTSAAGIAFLLAQQLLGQTNAWPLIELATIGVVADQIPLTGINRNLVFYGLQALQNPTNPGLKQIYQLAGLNQSTITTYSINFVIAPRLNAMGRLKHGLEALRLLCVTDSHKLKSLALKLETTNRHRQDLTRQSFQQALTTLSPETNLNIVVSDAYHEGIIGLIAGKLVEETGKPSIAISIQDEMAKGSARSIEGVDITRFLRTQANLLISVGGHPLAAGFTLKVENLDSFIANLNRLAKQFDLSSSDHQLVIDGQLSFSQINLDLYTRLESMAPFGLGNPRPLFFSQAEIVNFRYLGYQNQHLKLQLVENNHQFEAIWFNFPADLSPTNLTGFVFHLNLNSWRQQKKLQLIIHHAF